MAQDADPDRPTVAPQLHTLAVVFSCGVSVVGTSFALYGTSRGFILLSTSRTALNLLPGSVVASIIWNLGDDAFALALVGFGFLMAGLTGSAGYVGYRLGRRVSPSWPAIGGFLASTALVGIFVLVAVGGIVPAVGPAIAGGLATVLVVEIQAGGGGEPDGASRRTLLKALGGVALYNVVAHALGLIRGQEEIPEAGSDPPQTNVSGEDGADEADPAEAALVGATEQSFDVSGMSGLVSEIGEFYTVDINPRPAVVDTDQWSLTVRGAVDQEREFDYEAIRSRNRIHRFKTLRCLGDPVDGKQIGTALWTGCSLGVLLDETSPAGSHAMLRAVDGYYYSMPLEFLDRAVLAYEMNGETLPRAHGYPVRALIPNRWGKLNVKWLEEIEIIDDFDSGYWEERGWNGMGPVNTVVKIQATNRLSDGRVQLAGHAYAGTRGVQEVEISLDAGDTWETAAIADPLSDPDTWRQWKYEFQPEQSDYSVAARATDGTGETQTRIKSDPYPDGATGWARLDLTIQL
jgi:hypothetical protein